MTVINPFNYQKPNNQFLISRSKELNNIINEVINGVLIALIGPRRMGKTTLAKMLQKYLEDNQNKAVLYVDLSGVDDLEYLIEKLEDAYKYSNIKMLQNLLKDFQDNWELEINLKLISTKKKDKQTTDKMKLEKLLKLPESYYKESGQPVHIIFDEFQNLNENVKIKKSLEVMRAVIQYQNPNEINYTFLGSQATSLEKIFSQENKVFYTQVKKLYINLIEDPKEIIKFLENNFEQDLSEIKNQFVILTNRHPYRIMALAHYLFEEIKNKEEATIKDLANAYNKFMDDIGNDECKEIFDNVNKNQQFALRISAESEKPYSSEYLDKYSVTSENIQTAYKLLINKGIITKEYNIIDPFLKNWILDNKI